MKHSNIFKQAAITAGLLALCTLPATLRAQTTPQSDPQGNSQAAPARHGGDHEGELAKLNLSPDQKTQVKKIHEDAKSQADAVKNDSSLTDDQKQAKLRSIHEAAHEQVKQLLTPEQRAQMKTDEKSHRAEHQQNNPAPPQQ